MIKLIAFDFSRTLVSYSVKKGGLSRKIEKALGIRISKDAFFYEKLKFLQLLYGERLLDVIREDERESLGDVMLLIREDVLEEMAERYRLAVVSNNTREMIERALEKLGVSQYFDEIIAFEDAHPKPSVDPYLVLKERTGIPPENILAVGDTNADALSAKSAGALFIAVGRRTILADLAVSDVNEVASVDVSSLTEFQARPVEFYRSRKNTVFRTEDELVVKEHLSLDKALFEVAVQGRLYLKKLRVPRPVRLVGKRIVMEHIDGRTLMDSIGNVKSNVLKSVAALLVGSYIYTGMVNMDSTLRNFIVAGDGIYMVDFEDFAPGSLEESLGVMVANIFSVRGIGSEEAKRLSSELIRGFREIISVDESFVDYALGTLERKVKGFGRHELVEAISLLESARRDLESLVKGRPQEVP